MIELDLIVYQTDSLDGESLTMFDSTGFDVPSMRLEPTEGNRRWLIRNLAVRNSDHPRLKEVVQSLVKLKF
jgi:hypothetical protein